MSRFYAMNHVQQQRLKTMPPEQRQDYLKHCEKVRQIARKAVRK